MTIMPRIFKTKSTNVILCAALILAAAQLAGCSSREERAQGYYEQGMSYIAKKDFVKARVELRNALQLNGNMVQAWRALAQVDEHDNNLQDFAATLRKIVEIDPKDVQSKVQLARIYVMAGALDEGLKTINAASELDPNNASILTLKAAALFRLKDTDGAVKAANAALVIEPGNSEASVIISAVKFSQGDSDGALKALDAVDNAHKDDLGVLFMKINIFNRTGDLVQAESLLRKLITLQPNNLAFRTQLTRFYLAHKRPDDALSELRTAAKDNPADSNIEFQLVNLIGTLKGAAAARTELVAKISSGGNVFPYQVALAKLDFSQGNTADSTQLLEKLISTSKAPDDVRAAQTTLAELYMSKNNVSAAEPLVTDILRADSRNTNGLRMRAGIRIDRGQIDDAIADLRTALNEQPQSPELLATLAVAYERNGSIELADKAFLDATKASRFSPVYGLNYVAFLRRRGLADRADSVLADLANRNPNNIAVLSSLAQVKLRRQDWAGAHALADTIRRLGDKADVADRISGAAFIGEKKYDDSIAVLQNLYDTTSGGVQPMVALVTAYVEAKQFDKAETFLQAALKANPANAEALVLLGSVQLAKNDSARAEQSFELAIKQQPKDTNGYKALADLYTRERKIDEALKIIDAGLEQQPKSFALQLSKAGLLEIKGQYDPAISEYESMLKEQPGSMIVANNLASLLADHRTDKASLNQAKTLAALLKNSDVPQFKDTLGWVTYQQGDYGAAITLLEDAAAKLPNYALVQYHLGMSYLANGDEAKASEQFKKAQALAPNDAELKTKIDAALKARSDKLKG
jgi:tetratricopeptide (TPR) repeat protein